MDRNNARSISILLVEDNKTDSFLVEKALRKAKVLNNLKVVRDGFAALSYLRREGEWAEAERPDLILLDLNLPKMDGRKLLAELKSDPELQNIPVVVLTTSDDRNDVAAAYDHHANSFIVKPFHFKDFERALSALGEYWLDIVTLPPKRIEKPEVREASVNDELSLLLVEDEKADALVVRASVGRLETPIRLTHVTNLADAKDAVATTAKSN